MCTINPELSCAEIKFLILFSKQCTIMLLMLDLINPDLISISLKSKHLSYSREFFKKKGQ